jgi:hypothetical protein
VISVRTEKKVSWDSVLTLTIFSMAAIVHFFFCSYGVEGRMARIFLGALY